MKARGGVDSRFTLLLSCFFLSGFAALLYQTAWTRELSFVFGTSELAVAAVLAAYMGGLALGAAVASRSLMQLRRPVLVYGVLELAIAVSALLVPLGIRGVNLVYVQVLGGGDDLGAAGSPAAALLQVAGAFAVLLPPTAFMGATLPLLARHAVHREEQIASRVGLLYAVNTAGAIAGTLCAGFWLMPELGLRRTVWVGAGLNALVFALAALLARSAPVPPAPPRAASRPAGPRSWVLPAIAVSGAVSFAYEVMWTRLLGHLLGASVQAFSTMLASFLLGIAIGSALAARVATTRGRAALGFAASQLGIALTSYGAFALCDRLPDLASALGAGPGSPLPSAAVAIATLLPITLCIGATFPFAVRVLASGPHQAAAATGRVYAWNTVGAIAGSLGAGFLLLPALGFEGSLAIGVGANLCLAGFAAVARAPRRIVPAGLAAAGLFALVLAPPRLPWRLLTTSPMRGGNPPGGEIEYLGVGRTTSVLIMGRGGGFQIYTDGLPEASIDPEGMLPLVGVTHWLGALPALVHPEARRMLVVGLGGGVALELVPSTIESIDVIELEPEVLEANRRVADRRARNPLADPRVGVHLGDARGSLQLTSRRYDAIVSQPSHPWTAGASHLYTREFFELVRSRLAPDGVFVQWIGLKFVDEPLLRSLLAALTAVFPHVELFQPHQSAVLFVASQRPIDPLQNAARGLRDVPGDFDRLGLHRLEDFAAAWVLSEGGVRSLASGVAPNTDDHNRLASRSAGLGSESLDPEKARRLLRDHDPLATAAGLDLSALVRELVELHQLERANDLAIRAEPADEEAALGWLEIGKGRNARAARHFERALSLDPGHRDALAGRIAASFGPLSQGRRVAWMREADLEPELAALVAGWQASVSRDWPAVAAIDAELARIRPGDPLFEEAAPVRIARRLAAGEAESAAEAQELAETLLRRRWVARDALLRARAAILAGRPRAAWASLWRVAQIVTPTPQGRAWGARALEIAEALPEELWRSLQEEVSRRSEGSAARVEPDAAPRAGTAGPAALRVPQAPPGSPR